MADPNAMGESMATDRLAPPVYGIDWSALPDANVSLQGGGVRQYPRAGIDVSTPFMGGQLGFTGSYQQGPGVIPGAGPYYHGPKRGGPERVPDFSVGMRYQRQF